MGWFQDHMPLPDTAFSLWQRSGIGRLRDLYTNNVLSSFSELCEKFNLPKSHPFRYFQVSNFVKSNKPFSPDIPPNSVTDSILDLPTNQKRLYLKNLHLNLPS